jgi:hypothetical protein
VRSFGLNGQRVFGKGANKRCATGDVLILK